MDGSLCKMRKGTPNEIFRAEFQELVNEKYNDPTKVYTDESKKEEKVGYAVIIDQQSTWKRIRDQSSIFSAEQEAVRGAIQKLPTTGVRGVIFTDSLSTMMAASGNNHTKNPNTKKIRQLMGTRKGNLTLCWVPGHVGITGNEEADEEAKRALEESIPDDEKYPAVDLSGWIKTEIVGSRQSRLEEGEDSMKEIEKNMGWQNDTENLKRRDQVTVIR
jgi:ribonuclease HI